MNRLLPGSTLVVASHNQGKLLEIAELIRPFAIKAASATDLGLPEPEETELTFAGNALLKARAAAKAASLPALSDDSGLCVDALGGEPGVHSARWAGPERNFGLAMNTLQRRWAETGSQNRAAHFICALALAWPDGDDQVFEGRVDGKLVWPPRGDLGFGYDPMFLPDGYSETFGEMTPAMKHAISHRARAFAKFVEKCLG